MSEFDRKTIIEAAREVPVVAQSDVVVVGGGAAGVTAAISAARNGCKVTLLERYHHLGGMASGGMVLVLDDMTNGREITVSGIIDEFIARMEKEGSAVVPPESERVSSEAMWRKWSRWGVHDFHSHQKPQPITYAVAFDPDAWKRTSLELLREAGVELRLHSWFSQAIVEDGRIKGVIAQTKIGRQAILGDIVIDTTGDLDVAAGAGAAFMQGQYIVTTVFRLVNVDTEAAERFQFEHPQEHARLDREARRIIGGAWEMWWLKTPIPGVIWCNCPHMPGYDGISVEALTKAEHEGRERMMNLYDYARANLPGFENCRMLGAAEQIGVRQTRLLSGEYVVTKDDVVNRRHFADTVCRGRDYYTPYRALLPRGVEQLIVAGRHYSAEPQAQRMSREIPPCMMQGEAAGVAAGLALNAGKTLREVDAREIQRRMREQGADPGDVPSANALIAEAAA
ncbi:FAD-dependent oxidoreductase [Nitratireductor sp. ZSWI3]|uniref:FAD-dependent oxidoreductase n=1 Tax=Nitratireductor sp. ZSWI3 TaxID=2966359 RepID=UPI0021501417|nr:FAD-dependent oxidoreductase [Nitratireductor sp. ZSWI3]MCR4268127.1 FAD-dependent oxidoreductase [Nitratireductor sp. ZSWI3]